MYLTRKLFFILILLFAPCAFAQYPNGYEPPLCPNATAPATSVQPLTSLTGVDSRSGRQVANVCIDNDGNLVINTNVLVTGSSSGASAQPQFAEYTIYGSSTSNCLSPSVTGTTICARNNATGAIDYSGTDVAIVVNSITVANATVGGHLFFKQLNGGYPANSATLETATNCNAFQSSGSPLAWVIGLPSNTPYSSGVQWMFEGETAGVWQGEEGSTVSNTNGTYINVTATAISSVTAGSVIAGFFQRPISQCIFNFTQASNDVVYKNIGIRFPANTRGNEIGFAQWFSDDVNYYGQEIADFAQPYNTIATGSAPAVGTYNSIAFTSTGSSQGNWQNFQNTYATGWNLGYDFQSEHVMGWTVTAIYNNIACEFGRSATAIYHPIRIFHFVDQENGQGCIWGPNMVQGAITDIDFDFELGNDANWYSTARNKQTKLSEVNNGYGTGILRYQAVQANTGVVAEIPAASLFMSGGVNFQAFEGTNPPSIALVPITDTMTRPNASVLGPAWQVYNSGLSDAIGITSNAAVLQLTGAQSGFTAYLATSFNSDQFSKITVSSIDSSASSFAEVLTNENVTATVDTRYAYYCSHVAAGGSGIIKTVTGTATTLASQTASIGCNAGDTIELRHIGNTLWAYRNGAIDTSFTNPVIDSSITGGAPGFELVQDATGATTATNWNGGSMPTLHGTDSIYNNTIYGTAYATTTNCAVNSVSPAACGAAANGAVVIPTTTATYTINTTAVSAHSRIQLTWLTFASDLPGTPTCVAPAATQEPTISAVSPGVSFTIALASTVGQTCPMYLVTN
jgi:hypothetical protein